MSRIGKERGARPLAIEEIKPLSDPDQGMARDRLAAADGDRVIAAETWRIDLRVLGKSALVSLIAEAPDRPILIEFELRPSEQRLAFGEISHRIEATGGETGYGVDRQLVTGRRSPGGPRVRRYPCPGP